MKKKVNIIEKPLGRFITEYIFDYENISNVSDEDFLENAWQTAIKDELVNRNDRSGYSFQLFEDETLTEKGTESDKFETPVL